MSAVYFAGMDDMYALLDIVANATLDQMNERLQIAFNPENRRFPLSDP